MSRASLVLVFASLTVASAAGMGGCARGVQTTGGANGGNGGNGGDGGAMGGTGGVSSGGGGAGNTGNVMQGGAGGDGGGTGGSGNAGNSGGNGGSGGCAAGKHLCGGLCVGNTPSTGCFGSASCNPCPNPPAGGTTVCTDQGVCDFTCTAPYMKSGNACVCGQACCSNADCPGGTCTNGACVAACDDNACQSTCFLMCFPGLGLGMCGASGCECVCL